MSKIIKKFAILGERCSGTNFLEESITNNFNLEYTAEYGNKHFFCYNKYDMNSTKETLFIGIIRNPIYWINSFSKELYHVPEINKELHNFLFNEFYSVEENNKNTDHLSSNNFFMNNNLITYIICALGLKYVIKSFYTFSHLKRPFLLNNII